jgi:hypothetical protein
MVDLMSLDPSSNICAVGTQVDVVCCLFDMRLCKIGTASRHLARFV